MWEPHPTRDGAPPSRAGSPPRGGFPPTARAGPPSSQVGTGRCRRVGAARRVGRVPVPRARVAGASVPGPDRRCSLRLGEAAQSRVAQATASGACRPGPGARVVGGARLPRPQAGNRRVARAWRYAAAGWRAATAAEAVSRPPRYQGGRVRRGAGLPRRGGVVWRAGVGRGRRDVTANPCATTSAQQGFAADCLQPCIFKG